MATATHQPELGDRQGRRVSEQELKEAIRLHSIWLSDITAGQRRMFGGRDLSGLQFGVLGGAPIDLNGADFAGALRDRRR